jgi:threonyl-tRNA synthetase
MDLETKRHSYSHILAAAVKELWPEVKLAIGPSIENGFYYDFDFGDQKIGEEDLRQIEKKMKHIIKQNKKFEHFELSVKEALDKERKNGQIYKEELIKDLIKEGEIKVNYFKTGNFEDLCRGPHIESTLELNKDSFNLNKLAGAYWRGDEKNKMLTRIYGIAFDSKDELDEYKNLQEEAKKEIIENWEKSLIYFVFRTWSVPGCLFFLPTALL